MSTKLIEDRGECAISVGEKTITAKRAGLICQSRPRLPGITSVDLRVGGAAGNGSSGRRN